MWVRGSGYWLDTCLLPVVMVMVGQTACGTVSYINPHESGTREGMMVPLCGSRRGLEKERSPYSCMCVCFRRGSINGAMYGL